VRASLGASRLFLAGAATARELRPVITTGAEIMDNVFSR
jgi:hypothetical protein